MIKYVLRGKPTEKLVELAQSGLPEAMDLLVEKFNPMVVKIASQFYAPWAEFDDIVQNGLIRLNKSSVLLRTREELVHNIRLAKHRI